MTEPHPQGVASRHSKHYTIKEGGGAEAEQGRDSGQGSCKGVRSWDRGRTGKTGDHDGASKTGGVENHHSKADRPEDPHGGAEDHRAGQKTARWNRHGRRPPQMSRQIRSPQQGLESRKNRNRRDRESIYGFKDQGREHRMPSIFSLMTTEWANSFIIRFIGRNGTDIECIYGFGVSDRQG